MAIERKHRGNPRISEPGEYVVHINSVTQERSKKGKPMATIEFETINGQKIKGYYVLELPFHQKALADIKRVTGVGPNETLVGKSLGIAVEAGKPSEDGFVFMQITGYGTCDEVENSQAQQMPQGESPPPPNDADMVPF